MGAVVFTAPRPLRADDALDGFSCGLDIVDDWLRRYARTARRAGSAVVYVSFCENELAGFYTLSSQSVECSEVRGWLSRNAPTQIPVILLGMLGVDKKYQGRGLGRNLLLDASKRAYRISDELGAKALIVDPADANARRLYLSCGFTAIPDSNRLFAKLASQ